MSEYDGFKEGVNEEQNDFMYWVSQIAKVAFVGFFLDVSDAKYDGEGPLYGEVLVMGVLTFIVMTVVTFVCYEAGLKAGAKRIGKLLRDGTFDDHSFYVSIQFDKTYALEKGRLGIFLTMMSVSVLLAYGQDNFDVDILFACIIFSFAGEQVYRFGFQHSFKEREYSIRNKTNKERKELLESTRE
tara:strand:+ start:1926 stop:2480 length:555 start_codon:yes stop_codon:yes gene_type:complete